jgi:hypothetical protein
MVKYEIIETAGDNLRQVIKPDRALQPRNPAIFGTDKASLLPCESRERNATQEEWGKIRRMVANAERATKPQGVPGNI